MISLLTPQAGETVIQSTDTRAKTTETRCVFIAIFLKNLDALIVPQAGFIPNRKEYGEPQDSTDTATISERASPPARTKMVGGRQSVPRLIYLVMTRWPRRFCCQQASLLSVQNGFSLP